MVNFETRAPGIDRPITYGKVSHVPRIGESFVLQGMVLPIENVLWEFDQKYETGALVTLILKLPEGTTVCPINKEAGK